MKQPETPAAADSRVSAMGGVSQNAKEQTPLPKTLRGRHASAVVRRGCTQLRHEGRVLDADLIKIAVVYAVHDIIFGPLRELRLKNPLASQEFPTR